ncbi:MAG: DUF853 domain-containing protein, partial [Planctomycetes bacterium]|nr:DUF853 domain-containing protein [Planctomycetota bacterium]
MLTNDDRLLIARSAGADLVLTPGMVARHGVVTGATGTGKTVTLQVMAESLSAMGVPVFITDIKGDVSGVAKPGSADNENIQRRVESMDLAAAGFAPAGCPVELWDIFGQDGLPLRATITEMGPLLLSRILDLNDIQSGVMSMIFRIADDNGLLLLDLKDLRKMTEFVAEHRAELSRQYGNIATATVGAIQRALITLEGEGGDVFFGEPALDVRDLLGRRNGQGVVSIMAADRLMQSPRIYSAFLLWLLSELYETLPETGDLPEPKLVLFFDEAHLLFDNAPRILLEKIEQVVRLIRSKAVGVYFVTQNPMDIPEPILAQLGNRVQHALRAYTPREQRAVRAAADAFRPNPAFKTEDAIGNLAVGEALVSFLDEKGVPGMVERANILPPEGQIGPLTADERRSDVASSPLRSRYETAIDRESAYEMLTANVTEKSEDVPEEKPRTRTPKKAADKGGIGDILGDFTRKTQQS